MKVALDHQYYDLLIDFLDSMPFGYSATIMFAVSLVVGTIQSGDAGLAAAITQWLAAIASVLLGGASLWAMRNDARHRKVQAALLGVLLLSTSYIMWVFNYFHTAIVVIHNIAVTAIMVYMYFSSVHSKCHVCQKEVKNGKP
jgi:hypothetical protein